MAGGYAYATGVDGNVAMCGDRGVRAPEFNTVNFGNTYTGNGRSASFQQPTGFIPGVGYARQVQLGARLLF